MDFSQLSAEERPREKLLKFGPEKLSLAELLAVILRTGIQGEDVMAFSHGLIARMGGLQGLARASTAELMMEKGLKEAKVAALSAALEIGRRIAVEAEGECCGWESMLRRAALDSVSLEREVITAFYLGVRDRYIGQSELSYGGIEGAFLDVPLFFRQAVRLGASQVVLLHNHPDGSAEPSTEDIRLSEYVAEGLKFLGMRLKAHYVAAGGRLRQVRWQMAASPSKKME